MFGGWHDSPAAFHPLHRVDKDAHYCGQEFAAEVERTDVLPAAGPIVEDGGQIARLDMAGHHESRLHDDARAACGEIAQHVAVAGVQDRVQADLGFDPVRLAEAPMVAGGERGATERVVLREIGGVVRLGSKGLKQWRK